LLKKLLSVILLAIAVLNLALSAPALADTASGAKIFSANCAACHAGGRNVIMANKTLKKKDLETFGMYSAEAIITKVTNGKNALTSLKAKLSSEKIEDFANYVLAQAEKGWK